MLADALGRRLRLILTGGQVHDIVTAPALLEGTVGRLSHKIDREWGACGVRRTGLNSRLLSTAARLIRRVSAHAGDDPSR